MAGWKLRKDKSSTEGETAPETTDPGTIAPETADTQMPVEAESDFPTFDQEDARPVFDLSGAVITPPPPAAEMGEESPAFEPSASSDFNPDFNSDFKPNFDADAEEEDTYAPSPQFQDVAETSAPKGALRYHAEAAASAQDADTDVEIPVVAPFVVDAPPAPEPTADIPARLVVRVGRLSANFELTKDVATIGRPDSELHFYPDVEIELDDAVSRRHAEVIRRGKEYYLVDSGSTNGTLLNGETMTPHEEYRLAHGDRIHVGERTEIIFE